MSLKLHYDFAADKSLVAQVGPTLTITRASIGTYFDSAGVRQTALANTARFDHLPTAPFTSLGLMIEEERTNLFLNSDAPVTQGVTTVAADYTVWMEGTGSVTLSGTGSGVATEGSPVTVACTAGTLTLTVAGSVDIVQVEKGSFATSYIPTAGSAVVRNADVVSTSDVSWWVDQNDGTWYGKSIQYGLGTGSNIDPIIFNLQFNATNYIMMGSINRGASLLCRADGGADASSANNIIGTMVSGVQFQAAMRLSLNDCRGYLDGVQGAQDTSFDLTGHTPFNKFYLHRDFVGQVTTQRLAELRYYDTAFTDSELEDASLGIFPAGCRNWVAITRRTADQMRPKQRMPKPRDTLRGKFE